MKITSLEIKCNCIVATMFLLFFVQNYSGFSQIQKKYLSESWIGEGGLGAMFTRYSTLVDDNDQSVYTVGNTINNQYADVLIQKRNGRGEVTWSVTYPATPLNFEYNAPVLMDIKPSTAISSSKLYVLSSSYDSVTLETKMMVKKINSNGITEWTYVHSSAFSTAASSIGTAIKHGGNSVYVTGIAFNNSSMTDFLTFSIDDNLGTLNWERPYDNNNLQDYPAKIICRGGTVYVTGASQDSLSSLSWSILSVAYNASNGIENSVSIINSNSFSGVNNISDLSYDNDYIYSWFQDR